MPEDDRWVYAVELGGLDHAVEDGRHLGAATRAVAVEVLAADDRPAQNPLSGIVVQGDPGILEEEGQTVPVLKQVAYSLAEAAAP